MKRVCVLFGGASTEYEVSLRSASAILRSIPAQKYQIVMIGITKEGRWLEYYGPVEEIESGEWELSGKTRPAILSPDTFHKGFLTLEQGTARIIPVDVVFPVLHGKNGEDGTIQGLLDLAGIPYVGCGLLASAVCMDKAMAHVLLQEAGIPKTRLEVVLPHEMANMQAVERRVVHLGYPMFVKPANAGSSVGVTKVKEREELEAALRLAFQHDDKAVVEQMVVGQEVECAVMGNLNPIASNVIGEIVPPDGVYDYESKYLNDSAGLYIPARVPQEVAEQVKATAVKAYRALGCRGLSRVDFFARADGSIVLNEINTMPGFTSISMFPKLFEKSDMSFAQIVDLLIGYALEKI